MTIQLHRIRLPRRTLRILIAGALASGIAACGDSTSPPAPNATVYLSAIPEQAADASVARDGAASSGAALHMGTINPASVDSINIEMFGIAAIIPTDTANLAASLPLSGAALKPINFRRLPTTGVDSLEIARGRLDVGSYNSMRLRFTSATITFNEEVTAGRTAFPAGTYPLRMMHGIDFAADAPSNTFTVGSSPTSKSIHITFDMVSSISSITTDSAKLLIMNPIFRTTVR